MGMVVKFGRGLLVLFDFDQSIYRVDVDSIPGGITNYIQHILFTTGGINRSTNYDGPKYDLTMCLAYVYVDLDCELKERLDILGVDYKYSE